MIWIFVVLFALSYLAIVVLPTMKRRRAAASREQRGRVAAPVEADELVRRLKAIPKSHPEIDVEVTGEFARVSWNLDQEARTAHDHEKSAHPTYMLELQILDGTAVNVRYAEGTILWETPDEGETPRMPSIEWQWPIDAVSRPEPEYVADSNYGPHSPRSLGHLVRIVRNCVLDSGYAWQPVIDITPGEGSRQLRLNAASRASSR